MNNAKIAELQLQKKKTSHIFHGIMTVLFVPWVIVWVICHMKTKEHNDMIDVFIQQEINS